MNLNLISINTGKLFELAEENPMEVLDMIRDVLEEYVKGIKDVRVHDMYFDARTFEFLIEYIVKCELGEVSVKLVHSSNPTVALRRYYGYEKQKE